MPSWNIHIAHVERLFAEHRACDLGIADENAFLFGNCAPDIYVGFMVPDASFHVDYCLTHCAMANLIPMPDADWFWDHYIARRKPKTPAGVSLALGAWAHLVADRMYNGNFRTLWQTRELPKGEELRKGKQGDFNMFGRTLGISSFMQVSPELVEAAKSFVPYSILPDDVSRAVEAANAVVRKDGVRPEDAEYRLLDAEWLNSVFESCNERLATWLAAWQQLEAEGGRVRAANVREFAGLPSATPDDPGWVAKRSL